MKHNFLLILVSYALVLAPGCKTTNNNMSSDLDGSGSHKTKKRYLSHQQKVSLSKAQQSIASLLDEKQILVQDAKGNIIPTNQLGQAINSPSADVYFVDNSNEKTGSVMMRLSLKTGYLTEKGRFMTSIAESKNTHISYSASLWERKSDKTRGEYLANSTKFSKLDQDQEKNITTMKSALADLANDMKEQASTGIASAIVKVTNGAIIVLVCVIVATFIVMYLLATFGFKSQTFGMISGFLYGASFWALVATGAVGIVTLLINGIARIFKLGETPYNALPDFKFQ